MRDEWNAQHNLRVGLSTARSSVHELITQIRDKAYSYDRLSSASSNDSEIEKANDIKWSLYELQSLAENYEERIEILQNDVEYLLDKLKEID